MYRARTCLAGLVALLLVMATAACGGDPSGGSADWAADRPADETLDRAATDSGSAELRVETPGAERRGEETGEVAPGPLVPIPGGLGDGAAGVVQVGKYRVRTVTGWSAIPVISFRSFTLSGGTVGSLSGGQE